MAIDCSDTAALVESAKCLCFPEAVQGAVQIYLLQQIAENTETPEQLMESAKCLQCIPQSLQPAIINYLLCQIVNA